jgi:hypothetical protein
MGNCKSSQINENIIELNHTDNSYILFDSCNESSKEKIYSIMDQRIKEAISKDKYNIGFCLKTFFLPNKISEESFYTYYDIYTNIETKDYKNESQSDASILKDVYVPYNIIFERLKRFINYSYTIHHTYWYIQYDHFDSKKYLYSTHEPYQLQKIDNKDYRWYGLLHINKIQEIPSSEIEVSLDTINDNINPVIRHE